MTLLGHDEAWREWRSAMASGRMHHAWLLTGPRGLGKGSFAREAARELVAEPGVAQPAAGAHPDILVIDHLPAKEEDERKREEGKPFNLRRNITIDQIRALRHRLETRPTLGSRRAVIVDPVDDLERNAANALLKSLEEPPAGTYFLLIAHHPGRLLPTIRSRCHRLRFAPLADNAIEEILLRAGGEADAAERAAAIAAARGSPAVALSFVGERLGPLHRVMQRILREGDGSFVLRGLLADEVGSKPTRERQLAAIDLAASALAGEVAAAPRARQARIIEAHAGLMRLAGQAQTYNFDAGLLVMEIGGLLASAAMPTEAA